MSSHLQTLHDGVPLKTYEMALQVWEILHCDKLHEAIPPLFLHQLLPDVGLLCPDFMKRDTEEVVRNVGIPDLVQMTF